MDSHKMFHQLALLSITVSAISICVIALFLPSIFLKAEQQYRFAEEAAAKFKVSSDSVWEDMRALRPAPLADVQFFSRRRRNTYLNGGGGFCKGCFTLACPMGPPGTSGKPGDDGVPGMAGNPGRSGNDGYDIQLETEQDLPCVICPAGPPGTRGSQGERGRSGSPGFKGGEGPPGMSGMDGGPGLAGLAGPQGKQGPVGPQGPQGDTLVAGIGIKGPNGPPGPQGMKGPPGPMGKSSKSPGTSGPIGPTGGIGATGKHGAYGQEGPYGPPGDPGMPASYCPSDCGVQNILAEVFPKLSRKHSKYAAPGASYASTPATPTFDSREFPQPDTGYHSQRFHDFTSFERRMRAKLLRQMKSKS